MTFTYIFPAQLSVMVIESNSLFMFIDISCVTCRFLPQAQEV